MLRLRSARPFWFFPSGRGLAESTLLLRPRRGQAQLLAQDDAPAGEGAQQDLIKMALDDLGKAPEEDE